MKWCDQYWSIPSLPLRVGSGGENINWFQVPTSLLHAFYPAFASTASRQHSLFKFVRTIETYQGEEWNFSLIFDPSSCPSRPWIKDQTIYDNRVIPWFSSFLSPSRFIFSLSDFCHFSSCSWQPRKTWIAFDWLLYLTRREIIFLKTIFAFCLHPLLPPFSGFQPNNTSTHISSNKIIGNTRVPLAGS